MRRRALILASLALLLSGLVGAARAAEPATTIQARLMDATFLADAPPPPEPVAVCVIDTGVTLTPDTAGAVVQRLNARGAPDLDDAEPGGHGTLVAAAISAPRNNWGGVGIWPWARIVSVRVVESDAGGDPAAVWLDYRRAIYLCLGSGEPVRVITISIGGNGRAEDVALLERAVAVAHLNGSNVVVAAGNDAADPNSLARLSGAFAVEAAGEGGAMCDFSNHSLGLLSAPGCPVELANLAGAVTSVDGTSFAAPEVAAVLAALRAYKPDLGHADAEALLRATTVSGPDGALRVDAGNAFRAVGLADLTPSPPPRPRTTRPRRLSRRHCARRVARGRPKRPCAHLAKGRRR